MSFLFPKYNTENIFFPKIILIENNLNFHRIYGYR